MNHNHGCDVELEQLPSGKIISVNIIDCSANDLYIKSLENAVYRSSPLPLPNDPAIFESKIVLHLRRQRMKKLIFLLIIIFSTNTFAELKITISQGLEKSIPIIVNCDHREKLCIEITDVIKSNLYGSGYF